MSDTRAALARIVVGVVLSTLAGCASNAVQSDASDVSALDIVDTGRDDARSEAPVTDAADRSAPSDVPSDVPSDASDAMETASPCAGDARLGTPCTTSNACEVGAFACVGSAVQCVGSGHAQPSALECRASAGACDVAEHCDGTSLACPADGFAPTVTECRASSGECDVAESCTGASSACPADAFRPVGTACAAGFCDATGACNASCTPGMACSTGNACERGVVDCSGGAPRCAVAGPASAGTPCRPAMGSCDVAESCSGSSTACPTDAFLATGVVCRPSANIPACDPAESCSGSAAACPMDTVTRAPASEVCNAVDDDCDGAVDGPTADAACGAGNTCVAGACVPLVTAPRLVAPQSTATVSSRQPVLRWALPSGTDGAQIQVCRDRACTMVVTTLTVTGTMATPATPLPVGVLFWRAFGRRGAAVGTTPSATWQFIVGARSTSGPNRSWGSTLDVNGDGFADVVVGAPGGASDAGRVHVYLGSATGLAAAPSLSLTGPDANGQFGSSVASAGDLNGDGFADLVVGAPNRRFTRGRVHVFFGSATGLAATPSLSLDGVDPSGNFGFSVASAGDVNGDGFVDLLVGADVAASEVGRAYLFLGSATGLAAAPSFTLAGTVTGGQFGWSVASAGDVNGDGFADLVVGALGGGSGDLGHAYLYLGSAAGPPSTPSRTFNNPDTSTVLFGDSVASAGDVNGDGFADVIIGVYDYGGPAGHAYLYLGSVAGLAATPSYSVTGSDPSANSGTVVASAGDINGDGFTDVILGASNTAGSGRAYVFFGSTTGLSAARSLSGPDANGQFGLRVASAGDVNGDGFADLVVGAPGAASIVGRAHLFLGSATGPAATPSLSLTGLDANGQFGSSVASAPRRAPVRPRA